MRHYDVLIVGAGHAGAQAAIALRQADFEGSIAIIGEEPLPPYERPPLSKDYLSGEKDLDRILLRPASFWSERDVTLVTGKRVETVEAEGRSVQLASGETLTYGALVWAAGSAARRLTCAGADLDGVLTLRTRDDADRLIAGMAQAREVVIIGGGYIGLEAAAVLRSAGKSITVVEAQERVLARVAGERLSRIYETRHRAEGVDIRLNAQVDALIGAEGRVTAVQLADSERLPAQLVIAGIGVIPQVGPLIAAGAEGDNGVHVDEFCRTSLPGVYAIGDCAAQITAFADGQRARIESVQNANDQATTAALHIAGRPRRHDSVPWFWSNQYDLRLQTIGLSTGHDQAIERGDLASGSGAVVYLKQGRVIALDCVNATRDYVQGRKLVLCGARPDPVRLADASIALKDLAGAD